MLVSGDEVADWVALGTGADVTKKVQAIGLVNDGELVAGAAYDCYSGTNIFAHIRIDGKVGREFYKAIFAYPFEQLGCSRITGWVERANEKAVKLNEHFGFTVEAVMTGAAKNGGDILLMVLWKKDCKVLNWRMK